PKVRKQVENLVLYDPALALEGRDMLDEGPENDTYIVASWNDLVTASQTYTGVKFLVFSMHGLPGKFFLPDGTSWNGMDLMHIANPRFLHKDARVLFMGCQIGAGATGDRFLDDVGKYLLRGVGGFVGATTVDNIYANEVPVTG